MPVIGQRKSLEIGKGYGKSPMHGVADSFREMAQNILQESGVDIFTQPANVMLENGSRETLKDFFIENSCDPEQFKNDPEGFNDHLEMMEEQFLNDREAVLEYSSVGSFNPVIGMTFPLHKNILMNNVFDKGAIQKMVAKSPKFTLSMETRILTKPDGTEIDMWKNQMDMTDAIDSTAPVTEVELTLPELGTTDILAAISASSLDNLSIETSISAVQVETKYLAGETKPDGTQATGEEIIDIWVPVDIRFTPGYGDDDKRSFVESLSLASVAKLNVAGSKPEDKIEFISGHMLKNKIVIQVAKGIVKKAKLRTRKDTSNGMLQTCSVKWKTKTDIVEIPSAIPINTPVSPEEVKDVGALYNVNQLTKIMSMINDVMGNYKDDKINRGLNESFLRLDSSQKISGQFDFAPREGYALDHVEWRHKTFFDALDTHVTNLIQVLNDPNMTITIFGRPDLIRKVTPTEYTYQSPQSIGPVDIEFTKTVVNASDKRVYQFISSQKLKNSDELTIILNPRNTERIIYRIYDYQMYVSNEIRNAAQYTLPAVHAFERWKFVEYQPVQGRIKILNPSGLKA